jgi:hypothetical protein
MAFAICLTLNLYSRKILYAIQNDPSLFSCFSIHEGIHLNKEDQQNRQHILRLIKTNGKIQYIKDIKDKQKLKAPTTYIEMMQQHKGICGLLSIFFGKLSLLHQAITSVI